MTASKRKARTAENLHVNRTSPSPAEVFRAIILASKKLPHFFDKALEESGLRLTEYRELQMLSVVGPTSMIKLSDEMLVTKTAVTAITDEMEQKGLVKRVRDTIDRRIVYIEITPEGEKLFAIAIDFCTVLDCAGFLVQCTKSHRFAGMEISFPRLLLEIISKT
jgi:DNA-binding MarR family transcriptional regulator